MYIREIGVIMKFEITDNVIEEIKECKSNSTSVVGWYAHSSEVRGPFNRWFKCSEVNDAYKQYVSSTNEDCLYAAAAMNYMPSLIEEYEKVKRELEELKAEYILLGVYNEELE